jgi:3-phenylpropionate/cinnamic acid dioxygenase small subunit
VITNVYIANETDTRAIVRARYVFFTIEAEGTHTLAGIGWYDDEFVFEDGCWRVSRRRMLAAQDR